MMTTTHHEVLDNVLSLMTQLAGDWEYPGEITPDTRLVRDLAMESLGLVVLGTAIQERYGRLPFAEFLAEIGQRPLEERDLSIGELVEFVCLHGTKVAVAQGV
jgi:acyl carrier protein